MPRTGSSKSGAASKVKSHTVHIKRAYDEPSPDDGSRILVDRLWPRGVPRDTLALDDWLKDIAPSDELRRWFGHDVARWQEFVQRYLAELEAPPASDAVAALVQQARKGNVTLVYAARDTAHNNAVVLRDMVTDRLARKHHAKN